MPTGIPSIDIHRLIAEVAARHSLFLKPSDPAIALVTMNQLILDAAVDAVNEQIRVTIAEFQASFQKAEKRAGTILAQSVKESTLQMQQGLRNDIHVAGLKAREIVHLVNEAHRRPALIRWSALGIAAGVLLFGGGFWLGTLVH
jgi:Iap family predicted aminopeptidase